MRFVGKRRGVGQLIARAMVWHRGIHREARGFSWAEIEKSGAFSNGIVAHVIIDERRKSCLKENMAALTSFIGHGMGQKRVN